MATENGKAILEAINFDDEDVNINDLEKNLNEKLEEKFDDLEFLKEESEHINNPDHLGETVMNVVWEQFMNQVATTAGEDFIKENGNLKLNLSNAAHIQTAENFEQGKIATHNNISREQLEKNYDRYINTPHKEFRDKYVDPKMDDTLKRAGNLKKDGIDTVKDIYTGKQIPTETKLANGRNNPKAAQREHVIPSAECYDNASLQMANTSEGLADIINSTDNLQGYTTAERNKRKSDKTSDEMDAKDKNKHWKKANEKAEEYIKQKEKEGEERLRKEGRKTQKEEFYRVGKHALKTALMSLLATLLKEVIGKLVLWLKSANKNLKTLLENIKNAIKSFIGKLKQLLVNTADSVLTTIATSIIGPVIGTIKKTVTLLKQGWKSLKEAVQFLRKPENKGKPLSYLLPQVGIIVITGLSGIGAIALGEFIEKALQNIPFLAIEIPLLGSPANLIGMLMGAIVCGVIGAIAINIINRYVAKQQRSDNISDQIGKENVIFSIQDKLNVVKKKKLENTYQKVSKNVEKRHQFAEKQIKDIAESVTDESVMEKQATNKDELDKLLQLNKGDIENED